MKLLIVDDVHQKVEMVAKAVAESGLAVKITHETNARSARKRLRDEEFDLLLVDLQLPDVAGDAPSQRGGLEFFDLLMQDVKANLPAEILFITSEDGLVDNGRREVALRGSALCSMSSSNESWIVPLVGQLKLASRRAARKPVKADGVIVTALGTELEAVLALNCGWTQLRVDGDPTLYHKGTLQTDDGARTIVAASALRKGMAASSALATKLVLKFRPRLLAMTGICAGVRDKTSLGDVVVGAPTWDWGSGKHAESDEGSAIFKVSPKQSDLSVGLATLCHEIAGCSTFKKGVRANWTSTVPNGEFKCHVGPMASGASVIANASVAREISGQNRDLIAIEMEAFAVMVAAEYATTTPLSAIAFKSVCDFADSEKQDCWQPYAAYTSAQFANEFFVRFFSRE